MTHEAMQPDGYPPMYEGLYNMIPEDLDKRFAGQGDDERKMQARLTEAQNWVRSSGEDLEELRVLDAESPGAYTNELTYRAQLAAEARDELSRLQAQGHTDAQTPRP